MVVVGEGALVNAAAAVVAAWLGTLLSERWVVVISDGAVVVSDGAVTVVVMPLLLHGWTRDSPVGAL